MCQKKDPFEIVFKPLDCFLLLSILVVFVIVILEVFCRYVVHSSLPWVSEVSQTLLVWVAFLGAASAYAKDEHMTINIIMNKIKSDVMFRVVKLVANAAILLFLLIGAVGGWQLAQKTWGMTTTTLQIPAGILYMAFPLSCILTIPVIIRSAFRQFRRRDKSC